MKSVLCLLLFAATAFAQSSFKCPGSQEDMLTYFLMSYPDRADHHMGPGNANPVYSYVDPELLSAGYAPSGYFVWSKSANGYPWDVNTFDQNFIRHRATELTWSDPTSFKRQQTDLVIAPRCIALKGAGPNIGTPPSGTVYGFYSNCNQYQTMNLAYAVNSISKSTVVDTGGNLGKVRTRFLTYQYACDSNYANCGAKEVFALGQNIGLYDWKSYKNTNGAWTLNQDSVINQFTVGQTTPYFACPSTYQ